MTCGIYKISNDISGKVYIGQSINVESRLYQHKFELRTNNHHNVHLQNSFNKYGEDAFSFNLIKKCDECELDDFETHFIAVYDSTSPKKGYNVQYGGNHYRRPSEETKRKMSDSMKKKWASFSEEEYNELRKKLSEAHKGKHHSEETLKKLSVAQKKRFVNGMPEETRKKISVTQKKRYVNGMPEETRKKLSESHRKYWDSEEGKRKKEKTKEKREKLKEQKKLFWESKAGKQRKQEMAEEHSKRMKEYWHTPIGEEEKQRRICLKNTSGYYHVSKQKNKIFKQGFTWIYYYFVDGKQKILSSVNLNKLEEKVKSKGLEWFKLDDMERKV